MARAEDTGTGLTLRERAYEDIKSQILAGELAPGSAISEAELADVLGISRSPVREAFQQLAREGLVEIFPKRGTFVADLTPREVREAFELRAAIESACARLAAERATADDIAELEELCDAIDRAETGDGSYDAAAAFHAGIARAAHSRYLTEAFETGQAKIDMASRAAAESRGDELEHQTHRDIYNAIVKGDGEGAERIMRAHLEHSARSLIDRLL